MSSAKSTLVCDDPLFNFAEIKNAIRSSDQKIRTASPLCSTTVMFDQVLIFLGNFSPLLPNGELGSLKLTCHCIYLNFLLCRLEYFYFV